MLLPVLIAAFGPRLAVPILTAAQLVGNGSRVWFNRREIDYRVVGWLWRRLLPAAIWHPSLRAFTGIGAVSSLLSAMVGSVGPLMAPLFLAYGLVKGACIGTEACATVVMHLTRLAHRRSTQRRVRLSPAGLLDRPTVRAILHRALRPIHDHPCSL